MEIDLGLRGLVWVEEEDMVEGAAEGEMAALFFSGHYLKGTYYTTRYDVCFNPLGRLVD